MSKLNFSIQGESTGATRYSGLARSFEIVVDEPESLGGQDSAPNPVEYILAGYAGCLNVVIHLIAKELNIAIHSLNIDVDGDLNPAKFLGLSDDERAGFQNLNVNIKLESDANPEQEAELFALVKKRCPVNDNLANETPVFYQIQSAVVNN